MFTESFEKTAGLLDKIKTVVKPLMSTSTTTQAVQKPVAKIPTWVRQAVKQNKMKYVEVN